MRKVSHIIFSRIPIKEATNCWLRYILAQPVDLDMHVVLYLLRQYAGTETGNILKRLKLRPAGKKV